jgi:hypothetical protein
VKLPLFKDERRTSNIERPTSNEEKEHKNCCGWGAIPELSGCHAIWFPVLVFNTCSMIFVLRTDYCISISSSSFSIRRFTPWRDWTFDVRCSFSVSYSIKLDASAASGLADT